jgi:hypothetical protein
MSLAVRLRKLERQRSSKRYFHVWGSEDVRRQTIDSLIASGRATAGDLFICTGVPRRHHEGIFYEQSF